jgi:uncharacterized membrane protein YidH (DUF202 family)
MPLVSDVVLFLIVYAIVLAVVAFMNYREFKRCPEKKGRYKVLPISYKFACWLFVVPLFAAMVFHPAFAIAAVIAFALLEAACVRWYRKAGLY